MIIGICAPTQQSGKTTVANYFCEKYGFKKKAFATTLKKMLIVLLKDLKIHEERIFYYTEVAKEEEIPELGKSYRYLMRSLGTEWGRVLIHEDTWVKTTMASLSSLNQVVFEDIRMLNELKAIKDRKGILIKIINPRVDNDRSHASEGELDNVQEDYLIINDGTFEDLYKKVDEIMDKEIRLGLEKEMQEKINNVTIQCPKCGQIYTISENMISDSIVTCQNNNFYKDGIFHRFCGTKYLQKLHIVEKYDKYIRDLLHATRGH